MYKSLTRPEVQIRTRYNTRGGQREIDNVIEFPWIYQTSWASFLRSGVILPLLNSLVAHPLSNMSSNVAGILWRSHAGVSILYHRVLSIPRNPCWSSQCNVVNSLMGVSMTIVIRKSIVITPATHPYCKKHCTWWNPHRGSMFYVVV